MKISIIVPVHNSEHTLKRCVDSILAQTFNNVEILLIENGSSDNSYDMCREYAEKHTNISCYVSSPGGVSRARNLGLKCATGDIIGFCDADDELVEGAFEHIVNAFEINKDVICIIGGYYRITATSRFYMGDKKSRTCLINKVINRSIYDFRIMGSVWNKFFKKELLDGVYFDETLSYCEDTHFLISVLSKYHSQSAYILNQPVYCYIANEQSVTNDTTKLFNATGQLKYVDALEKISKLPNLKKHTRTIIGRQILWLSLEWYNHVSNDNERKILTNNIKHNILNCLKCAYIAPKQMLRTILVTLRGYFRRKGNV